MLSFLLLGMFIGHILTISILFISGTFIFKNTNDEIGIKIKLPFDLPKKDLFDAYIPAKDPEKILEGQIEAN